MSAAETKHAASALPAAQAVVQTAQAVERKAALLTPSLDVLMIGGASILTFVVAYLFVDKSANINQISWAAFYLAFVVNNPHFMSSYSLLYWDKRKELVTNKRFFWAAVVVPLLLAGYFAGAVLTARTDLLGYAVNAMFFLVGWHYVKQIYGCVVVTSVRRGYYLSKGESWALKLNLYPVWFMSFINGNQGLREYVHYGVGYKTLGLPDWMMTVNYLLLGASLAGLCAVLFRKWVREGKLPGLPALGAFAAIYVWYLPTIYHAHFWYLIPFFHSLQYLVFVLAIKRNQFKAEAAEQGMAPEAARMRFARDYFGFLGLMVLTAAIFFHWAPNLLDAYVPYDRGVFGSELFMYLFITFINVHHYFIDNVLWRRDNPMMKKYLLG